jgi:hypothetical protein
MGATFLECAKFNKMNAQKVTRVFVLILRFAVIGNFVYRKVIAG